MNERDKQCCGRGTHVRGTAGKGCGVVIACSVCYRDLYVRNGPEERAAGAEYEAHLSRMRGATPEERNRG